MKIYCSRRTDLERLIGSGVWFKVKIGEEWMWVQIDRVIRNRLYGCYKIRESSIEHLTKTGDLVDARYLWYIIHMHSMSPFPISGYKTIFEDAAKNHEVKTTGELFGYLEEQLKTKKDPYLTEE